MGRNRTEKLVGDGVSRGTPTTRRSRRWRGPETRRKLAARPPGAARADSGEPAARSGPYWAVTGAIWGIGRLEAHVSRGTLAGVPTSRRRHKSSLDSMEPGPTLARRLMQPEGSGPGRPRVVGACWHHASSRISNTDMACSRPVTRHGADYQAPAPSVLRLVLDQVECVRSVPVPARVPARGAVPPALSRGAVPPALSRGAVARRREASTRPPSRPRDDLPRPGRSRRRAMVLPESQLKRRFSALLPGPQAAPRRSLADVLPQAQTPLSR
jgi:hypothetical protein